MVVISVLVVLCFRFGRLMCSLIFRLKLLGIWLMLILLVIEVLVGRVCLCWLVMNFRVLMK